MASDPRIVYEFGPFRLDPEQQILLREDRPVSITRKVFETLLILVRRNGEVVTKDDLMKELWPDTVVEESNLSQNIFMLRKALGDASEERRYIVTLPGRGYRFAGELRAVTHDNKQPVTASHTPSPEAVEQREIAETVPAATSPPGSRRINWKYVMPIAAFMGLLAVGLEVNAHRRRPVVLGEKDFVLVADFRNSTGDPVFDDTLRQGLIVQLEQSPFLNLIPEARVQHTLGLMGQAPGARITGEVAREVCERTGGKAVLDGSIASLGRQYVIGLRAIDCYSGTNLDEEQAQAARKEDVLNALTQIATKVRVRMGESLATVKQYDTPLSEATTPSLEALTAYSKAWRANYAGGPAAAIPLARRAIQIDPNFAMAYAMLSLAYGASGEPVLSAQSATRAYQLRNRASDQERFFITTSYELRVTGNLDKARETSALWAQAYPRDPTPWNFLAGSISTDTGQYEKGAEAAQRSIELTPDRPYAYIMLSVNEMALGHLAEAEKDVEQAAQHKIDVHAVLEIRFLLAFLEGNRAEMRSVAAQSKGKPSAENAINSLQVLALAYSGQLQQARKMSQSGEDLAEQSGDHEGSAQFEVNAALREALFGNVREARRDATAALALSKGRDVECGAAFALALAGDSSLAQALANDLEKRFPEDTLVRFNGLPTLRAILALHRGNPAQAVELLEVTKPYELGVWWALLPVYVRGEAYLAEHRGAEAAAEFQKIIDHPGIVGFCPIGALAHLQLARAYTIAGDEAKARASYQDFLTLWKGADPEIPILKRAKTEGRRLEDDRDAMSGRICHGPNAAL